MKQHLLWFVLAILASLWQGPTFLKHFWPQPNEIQDFAQEWASARNYFTGRPIYANQEETFRDYLGFKRPDATDPQARFFLKRNAHPPPAVLLALPLGLLPYPPAFLLWNL